MKQKKNIKTSLPLYIALRIVVGIMLALSVIGIFIEEANDIKSQCVFITIQCALFLFVSLTPKLIKKIKVEMPDFFLVIFILFCFAHFFCGEILNFYATIKWWDSMLHTFAGVLLSLLCFSTINLLNDNKIMNINTVHLVIMAICCTITLGVLWEIVEFTIDSIFASNMQRAYHSITGEPFVGRQALLDTMKDLILDSIGAVIGCTTCGIVISRIGRMPEALISRRIVKNKQTPTDNEEQAVEVKESSEDSSIAQ